MRVILLSTLIVFTGAIVIFCIQNFNPVEVSFFGISITAPVALIVLGTFLFGMVSGGAILSFFRLTVHRVTEKDK